MNRPRYELRTVGCELAIGGAFEITGRLSPAFDVTAGGDQLFRTRASVAQGTEHSFPNWLERIKILSKSRFFTCRHLFYCAGTAKGRQSLSSGSTPRLRGPFGLGSNRNGSFGRRILYRRSPWQIRLGRVANNTPIRGYVYAIWRFVMRY